MTETSIKDTNKMICIGAVAQVSTGKIHQRSWVYDEYGLAPTICSTDYKDPKRVLVRKNGKY